jgi:hypothetical protein
MLDQTASTLLCSLNDKFANIWQTAHQNFLSSSSWKEGVMMTQVNLDSVRLNWKVPSKVQWRPLSMWPQDLDSTTLENRFGESMRLPWHLTGETARVRTWPSKAFQDRVPHLCCIWLLTTNNDCWTWICQPTGKSLVWINNIIMMITTTHHTKAASHFQIHVPVSVQTYQKYLQRKHLFAVEFTIWYY